MNPVIPCDPHRCGISRPPVGTSPPAGVLCSAQKEGKLFAHIRPEHNILFERHGKLGKGE